MKNKDFIKVLIFNIMETIIIFLLGNIFDVEVSKRIMFMVLFFITRMIIGKPKHYNKAYRCALWSFLVFLSLYSISSLDMFSIILLTIPAVMMISFSPPNAEPTMLNMAAKTMPMAIELVT